MADIKEDWQHHINVIANNIWYSGDITDISISDLIKQIQLCLDNKHYDIKINLFMCSCGGSITAALMFYNFLNLNYKHINVIGTSRLYSSATYFLFTKCDTFIYPDINVLFHPMNFKVDDTQQAVEQRTKLHKHLINSVKNIYLTKGFKCNWTKQDIYLFADDLIKKNIVDGIWQVY